MRHLSFDGGLASERGLRSSPRLQPMDATPESASAHGSGADGRTGGVSPSDKAFYIRHIRIDPPTALAPMEAITDAPFRALVRSMGGCGLVVTEFVSAKQLSIQSSRALQLAAIAHDSHPVSIQIYGRDPREMAVSAQLCESLGADLVDINMGCPSKAVTSGCAGVALMREPRLAQEIVRSVRKAISIPLTVKMRLGWDHQSINAPDLAHMCQEEGAEAITVHGRTRSDLYRGKANWERIGEVKARLSVPVFGNGDICSVADALTVMRVAGVDGVMAGRGVVKNPWLLRQIGEALRGEPVFHPSLEARRDQLLAYFALIQQQIPYPPAALGKMKKVTGLFTDGMAFASELRFAVLHSNTVEEAIDAVHRFFGRMQSLQTEDGVDLFQQPQHPAGSGTSPSASSGSPDPASDESSSDACSIDECSGGDCA